MPEAARPASLDRTPRHTLGSSTPEKPLVPQAAWHPTHAAELPISVSVDGLVARRRAKLVIQNSALGALHAARG